VLVSTLHQIPVRDETASLRDMTDYDVEPVLAVSQQTRPRPARLLLAILWL